jgi:hypothetical protein
MFEIPPYLLVLDYVVGSLDQFGSDKLPLVYIPHKKLAKIYIYIIFFTKYN